MTLSDYKAYAEQCATRNKSIQHTPTSKHFTVFTAEDALSELKSIKSPVLAAELPRIRLGDSLSDNVHTIMDGAFLIIKKAKQGDSTEVITAYEEMFVIAMQVLTKIKNDRSFANEPGRSSPEKLIKNLRLQDVSIVDVGPVFDSYYGWRIDFPFQSTINLELDESKWDNEIKFSE
ncbi:MAG: hypothetical protein V4608_03390 [Bacteroidota bacterium]